MVADEYVFDSVLAACFLLIVAPVLAMVTVFVPARIMVVLNPAVVTEATVTVTALVALLKTMILPAYVSDRVTLAPVVTTGVSILDPVMVRFAVLIAPLTLTTAGILAVGIVPLVRLVALAAKVVALE